MSVATCSNALASEGMSARRHGHLVAITCLLGVLTVLHDVDHLRQGRSLPPELYLVAVAALISIGATMTVLVRYRRWARTGTIAQGVATVIGVGAVHGGPQWAAATDSYSAAHADGLSWAIIVAMMLTGLALALVAVRVDL